MLEESPLGKNTVYVDNYSPDLLFAVPRRLARDKLSLPSPLPFEGGDLWNAYELSWLDQQGKPKIALGEFYFPQSTLNVVESKSLKLYLNSLNSSSFNSIEEVRQVIESDLKEVVDGPVSIKLIFPQDVVRQISNSFDATSIDHFSITINAYRVNPKLLKTSSKFAEETLCSDLLKSICMATGQPDWGSLLIRYAGPQIDHESLLRYIISFRNHAGFAEHCVEQIFHDIWKECRPEKLTVYARYTRRGGLDINPFRSNFEPFSSNIHLVRQ